MRYIRLTAVLLLAACGDGGTTPTSPPTPTTPVATSITVSPTSLSFSSVGATQQLSATVKDQNGATMSGATVTWATTEAAVATVSSSGLVTSVGNGTGSVLAVSGSINGTAAVTVAQVVSTLELSPSGTNLSSVGDTITLSATVKDSGGSTIPDATVTWTTSDTLIATVSAAGLVTAGARGSATITATSGSVSGTTSISVAASDESAPELVSLEFVPDSVDVSTAPDTIRYRARITDDITGVENMWIDLISPSGSRVTGFGQLTEGTRLDGYYEGDFKIPMASAAGEWKVSYVYMRDQAKNEGAVYADSLVVLGLPNSVTVTVSGSDSSVSTSVNGGVTTWTPLGTGEDHTCGVTATGEAYCWGANENGELGTGMNTGHWSNRRTVPVKVGGNW